LSRGEEEQKLKTSWYSLLIRDPAIFEQLIEKLENKNWYVYAKPPFGGPEHVLRYLGRYTCEGSSANQSLSSVTATKRRIFVKP